MTIAYDGTYFHGWQVQPGQRSVQHVLETMLASFGCDNPEVVASGRTDAGVHALGQRAHFDYAGSMVPRQMLLAFRTRLPLDVDVVDVIPVPDGFHARYDACEREYHYLLAKRRTPFNRNFTGFLPGKYQDPDYLMDLASVLIGNYDYSSFGRPNPNIPNRMCHVKEISITDRGDRLMFRVVADRFLHNMVRRIVGTLVTFGQKGLAKEVLLEILLQHDPRQTLVPTAPACGLYLARVGYPDLALTAGTPQKICPQ